MLAHALGVRHRTIAKQVMARFSSVSKRKKPLYPMEGLAVKTLRWSQSDAND
jgi:hypothetical protein